MGEASEPVSHAEVLAFFEALASRDPVRVARLVSDDVEWHMFGPIDLFSFCGYRRGKAAVVDYLVRLVPQVLTVKRIEPEDVIVNGDSAAMLNKLTAVQKSTGRIICYHAALFLTFRDGKVVSAKGLADTFDMAQQVMGYHIDAYRMPDAPSAADVIPV